MRYVIPLLLMLAATLPVRASEMQPPRMDVQTLSVNYPTQALKEGREGTVHYALVVRKNGKVKTCEISQSSGHEDLDNAVCSLMKNRVRFFPAKDANGKAVEGSYKNKLSFKIPQ